MGAVTPIGNSVEEMWASIKEGKNGIGPNTHFDTTDFASKVAGEVKDLDLSEYIDRKEARKMDDFVKFAMVATMQAMKQSGLTEGNFEPERMGVVIGNGIGGIQTLEESFEILFEKGPTRVPILTVPKMITNIGPGHVAIRINAQGPVYSVATACASGTDAIGDAARLIETGFADVVVTGGSEAPITKIAVSGFIAIKALSTKYNDTPEKACRPFDKDRDGFILSEGAGVLILEDYDHAKKRGATILAEYLGSGMTCDANHLTAPHPEARGGIQAIKMAIRMSGIQPENIDYINAHGTSTQLNDPTETMAIRKALGDHAYKVKVSSTKSMMGHLIGAVGAVEAIVCVKAMEDQFFPPTTNLEEADPACDLDYVPNKGYNGKIDITMSNSFGFGGHNGVLILKRYQV